MKNRCSVIAACNPEHVLRDVTGNRRFILVKLKGAPKEAIKWDYPLCDTEFSLQVLSQCKSLAESNYASSEESERIIAEVVEAATPDDPNADLVLDFEEAITGKMARDAFEDLGGLYPLSRLDEILNGLSRNHSLPRRTILCVLKSAGCFFRSATGRYYGLRSAAKDGASVLRAIKEQRPDKWEDEFM